jgi:tRNA (adenine58-N1)-methyltransferase non-catalytic subunit
VPPQEVRDELRADEYHADLKAQSGTADEIAAMEKEKGPGGVSAVIPITSFKKLSEKDRQLLTTADIELLKKDENTSAGKGIVDQLLKSHQALDEKTLYSLEKYKVTKMKKYRRQFSVLPFDTPQMTRYLLEEKDSFRVLEMREEMLGLVGCWANVHHAAAEQDDAEITSELPAAIDAPKLTGGRWLCVDDTGGLLVAAMAERMGILYPRAEGHDAGVENGTSTTNEVQTGDEPVGLQKSEGGRSEGDVIMADAPDESQTEAVVATETAANDISNGVPNNEADAHQSKTKKRPQHYEFPDLHIPYAGTNTITLLHSNAQPNLNLLKYYNYDISTLHPPFATHALYSNLLCVNWLQLIDPEQDPIYANEPPGLDADELATQKPARRGVYHRKRRRWARTRFVVDSTRAGGFSGLVTASTMDPISILRFAVPLLAPGATIAIYSPCIEPLLKVADCYSTARRSAWANEPPVEAQDKTPAELENWQGTEEFPLHPSLLLGTSVQTSCARKWQVLPGRTHPFMTSRGGAQGYVFTAWKTRPATGKVEARGKFKKRKTTAAQI